VRIGFLQGRRWAALTFSWVASIAACVALLAAVGCHSKSAFGDAMPIRTQIAPQPVRVGEETVTITGIVDGLGEPLAGVHIQVEGDMAHPGMPPVFSNAKETAPGTYQAELDFNMPGDWVVLEHIRLADGTRIERQTDLRGVTAQ
jgi:hypothetical protein